MFMLSDRTANFKVESNWQNTNAFSIICLPWAVFSIKLRKKKIKRQIPFFELNTSIFRIKNSGELKDNLSLDCL